MSLDECDKLLEVFSDFVCSEALDVQEDMAVAICFLRRMHTYFSVISVVRDKLIDAHDALCAIVNEGYPAMRKEKGTDMMEGANV